MAKPHHYIAHDGNVIWGVGETEAEALGSAKDMLGDDLTGGLDEPIDLEIDPCTTGLAAEVAAIGGATSYWLLPGGILYGTRDEYEAEGEG